VNPGDTEGEAERMEAVASQSVDIDAIVENVATRQIHVLAEESISVSQV